MTAFTMSVASANEAIPSKNKDIASLIPGDYSRSLKRLLLRIEVARNFHCARLSDRPSLPARNNKLTIGDHW